MSFSSLYFVLDSFVSFSAFFKKKINFVADFSVFIYSMGVAQNNIDMEEGTLEIGMGNFYAF